MDEYKPIIETTAHSDLRGILRYITDTLKEPVTAKRIYTSIKEKINGLDRLPHRNPLVRDDTLSSCGIRWMPAENYTVFYTIDDENLKVHILRILHNRREWQSLL